MNTLVTHYYLGLQGLIVWRTGGGNRAGRVEVSGGLGGRNRAVRSRRRPGRQGVGRPKWIVCRRPEPSPGARNRGTCRADVAPPPRTAPPLLRGARAAALALGLPERAEAQTEVPVDSALKPADIGAGGQFRLMFVSSTTRNATSVDIADYNTFVRTLAAAGVAAIQRRRLHGAGQHRVGQCPHQHPDAGHRHGRADLLGDVRHCQCGQPVGGRLRGLV